VNRLGNLSVRLWFLVSAVLSIAVVLPAARAAPPPSNAAVAARIAGQLGCQVFAYHPGSNAASGSQGQLDCHIRQQDFVVYVFRSNRERARGSAHLKLWSGPDDIYYFAQATRAILAPRGEYWRPAYTRKWATVAANRTGGDVFSG